MTINSPSITIDNQPGSLFTNMRLGNWFPPTFVFTPILTETPSMMISESVEPTSPPEQVDETNTSSTIFVEEDASGASVTSSVFEDALSTEPVASGTEM